MKSLLFFLFLTVCLSSCINKDDSNLEDLIGRWRLEESRKESYNVEELLIDSTLLFEKTGDSWEWYLYELHNDLIVYQYREDTLREWRKYAYYYIVNDRLILYQGSYFYHFFERIE